MKLHFVKPVSTRHHNSTDTYLFLLSVATFAPYAYHDVLEIGRIFATLEDDLDWTIARVPILISSENRSYRAGYIGEATTGHTLTREGFVAFVLDELESRRWIKKRPMLSIV